MTCGLCIAAERNWDPQYLRDPGKLCEAHERALDRLVGMVPMVRVEPELIMTDFMSADGDAGS